MIHPLSGVRVLEMSSYGTGPYCGMLLADMGATVIKVEEPEFGDPLRAWPPRVNGKGVGFDALNRNKKSVALDLKCETDRDELRKLASEATVFVHNLRPGVLARYGMDFDSMKQINDRIVYCSISAYGQEGPRKHEGGFDLTLQAMSGLMSVTGEENGPPAKCGVPVVDFSTGLFAAFSIASYVGYTKAINQAVHLDVSMLGVSLSISALQTAQTLATDKSPGRIGSRHPNNSPYQAYKTQDGFLAIAAGSDRLWEAVCDLLDLEDLKHDPRFSSVEQRAQNQVALTELLEAPLVRQTRAHWLDSFSLRGIPCAPVNSFLEALNDKQVKHQGWVIPYDKNTDQSASTVGPVLRVNGKLQEIYRQPPSLGAHNDQGYGQK